VNLLKQPGADWIHADTMDDRFSDAAAQEAP
jgi:pentose-5-phosphate-3-epimerase